MAGSLTCASVINTQFESERIILIALLRFSDANYIYRGPGFGIADRGLLPVEMNQDKLVFSGIWFY
jgi:hypothetical protein